MSLLRFGSTLARLSSPGTLTLVRRAAASDDGRGRVVPGPVSQTSFQGSVQPVSGRDLLRLPEGERTREMVALFSTTELRTTNEAAGTTADRVVIAGETYEVQTVERWAELGGYWRAVCLKADS